MGSPPLPILAAVVLICVSSILLSFTVFVPVTRPHQMQSPKNLLATSDIKNIAIGLKTGKETIERAQALLQTSLKGFERLTLFSDHSGSIEKFNIADVYHGLYNDTKRGEGWDRDAHKFLPGLRLLHSQYPDSPWFMMIDDDSTVFLHSIVELLKKYSSSRPLYMGAVNGFGGGCGETHGDTTFAHGGSGIVMSNAAVKKILPQLDKCIQQYRNCWAGDVRLGMCFHDVDIPTNGLPGFHGGNFNKEHVHFDMNACETPHVFHKVSFDDQRVLANLSDRPTYSDIFQTIVVNKYSTSLSVPQHGFDINGGNYKDEETNDAYSCMDACVADTKCVSYVFVDDHKRCYYKAWPGKLEKKAGHSGGILADKYRCKTKKTN